MGKKRIACFISGRGSNFKSLLDATAADEIHGEIVLVVSDNPGAKGLSFARDRGIKNEVIVKEKDEDRAGYFERIIEILEDCRVDLICLAGFMKVLSGNIVSRYRHRIINIHPALLPSFPGEEAQRQAVEYGVKVSGCTVHFVDEGVDTGPIILQETVPVLDGDTGESLASRILKKEHEIYPRAVKLFCSGRLEIDGRRVRVKAPC